MSAAEGRGGTSGKYFCNLGEGDRDISRVGRRASKLGLERGMAATLGISSSGPRALAKVRRHGLLYSRIMGLVGLRTLWALWALVDGEKAGVWSAASVKADMSRIAAKKCRNFEA